MESERRRFWNVLIFAVLIVTFVFISVGCASAATIYVNPGDSIQDAVNAASAGDTIIINSGVYTENVMVNKGITIEGVGMPTVNASFSGAVFTLNANSVTIRGLKILDGNDGIATGITDDHLIEYNIFDNNGYGMYISSWAGPSNNNVIRHNHFINSDYDGIQMFESGEGNLFYNNTFQNNNEHDIWLGPFITGNNQIYHNNFIEGGKCTDETNYNAWYNADLKEGNYWGDYTGTDKDEDGIGDAPYNILGAGGAQDLYPLMEPYKPSVPTYEPQISIYTDKTSYTAGDTMRLGLDVANPGDAQPVKLEIWLELPSGGVYSLIDTSVTLPAGLDYSKSNFKVFTVPSISAGTYAWQAGLSDPSTGTLISEDTAEWVFGSMGASIEIETADITEVLEQSTVDIDFGE